MSLLFPIERTRSNNGQYPTRILDRRRNRVYLLYSDETNLSPKDNDFFVYGAIAIPCAAAKTLVNVQGGDASQLR